MQESKELDQIFKLVAANVLTTIDMLHEAPPAQSTADTDVMPGLPDSDHSQFGQMASVEWEEEDEEEEETVYAPRAWSFYFRLAERLDHLL